MLCKICGNQASQLFAARVLNKYDSQYFLCSQCGFIQTSEPVWLQEAYESPINLEDTGLLKRNILFSRRTVAVIFFLFNRSGNFLDFAGGNGLFVRLMRDFGFNFYWEDPYTENIFARGFEYRSDQKIEMVTSFESFEHFTNPLIEIERMLSISRNLLFSTELYKDSPPLPDKWTYYAFSHGQHVSLYSLKTLKFIANKYTLNIYSNKKSFHLLTDKKIPQPYFNFLLRTSALGISNLISKLHKSKTEEDSEFLGNLKRPNK